MTVESSGDELPGTPSAPACLTSDDIYELLAHLVSSAELCTTEPWYYGTFRLIDAASRLSSRALERGFDEPWLRHFRDDLESKKRWMIWNKPAYFDFLGQAAQQVAERLLERATVDGGATVSARPRPAEL